MYHKSCLTWGARDGKCTEEIIPVGDAQSGSMWGVCGVEAAF